MSNIQFPTFNAFGIGHGTQEIGIFRPTCVGAVLGRHWSIPGAPTSGHG